MRFGVMLPLTAVGAVVLAVLAISPHTANEKIRETIPVQPMRDAADGLPNARSAAVMVAQDPLHSLLSEQDRVLTERKRFLDAMDAAYRSEPVDTAWSSIAEHALVDVAHSPALAETGITPDAWSTQCRSRSCKVTAVFGDYDDAQDWANFFLTGTGSTLAQAELSIQRGADNATHVLIFGARR